MAVRPLSRKFRRMSGPAFSAKTQPPEPDSELESTSLPEPPAPRAPIDRSAWAKPWAQLKYFTFQPAIFPRLLGHVSPDARPGDFVNVYDKHGNLTGGGLFNPRAKIPLRVVCHSTEPVNEGYFEGAIRRAVALRRDLFKLDIAHHFLIFSRSKHFVFSFAFGLKTGGQRPARHQFAEQHHPNLQRQRHEPDSTEDQRHLWRGGWRANRDRCVRP